MRARKIPDAEGVRLHDRATRGEALTADEKTWLEEWYAAQDEAEMRELGIDAAGSTELGREVEAARARLAAAHHRVQDVAAGNDRLRDENAVLRRRQTG